MEETLVINTIFNRECPNILLKTNFMTTAFSMKFSHDFILENPNYPSLGPHLRLLGFTGLWHPTSSKTSKFKQVLFYVNISFFISQYIKCFVKFDTDSLKLILQYAPFHMGIVKSCFFQKDHDLWEKLIKYTAKIELRQMGKSVAIDKLITRYIRQNRRVTYFFWALAFFSNFTIFSEPYQKNQVVENGTSIYLHIFDGYTPFEDEPPGYYGSMLIETVLGHIVSAYVVGWDTLVVSLMIFYAGQLKVAKIYCVRVIVDRDKVKSHQNIAEFHRYYVTFIEYQKLLNSLISPVMFIYLIVISVNLGVCIIHIVELQDDLGALASAIIYVTACLIQLLIFYWHGNEVTIQSTMLSYATFKSDWTEMDKILQKEIALLGLTTTKRMKFSAGPLNEMSLATFVTILRASYSFYTLMNGTN